MPQTIVTGPLTQMLKSIALQKRTGLLRVERFGEKSAESGEIYFEGGCPVRARAGQEGGRVALQRISEWRQVTCSFQGMSRPYPVNTRVLVPQVEEKPQAHQTRAVLPQTEDVTRLPGRPSPGSREMNPSVLQREQIRPAQASLPVRTVPGANNQAVLPPARDNHPLILHGERLEEYTPAPQARPSRTSQRWTTHQISDVETLPMSRKSPITPRLGLLPGEEVLPGRTAVFKVRAMVATAQAIQRMERRERIVFILLDGRRTIQDIARLTHQPEYDVEQILVHLTQTGYAQYLCG